MRRTLLIAFLGAIVLSVGSVGGAYFWLKTSFESASANAEQIIEIERGQGVRQIAASLSDAGLVSDPRVFELGLRLFADDAPLKAGEFRIPANSSPAEIARVLQRGERVSYNFTVAEGLTSFEIVALLRDENRLTGDISVVPAEGSLLPETYQFHRNDTRASMIARMQTSMTETVNALWTKRKDVPLETPSEALVLASIVEKETALAEERRRVAAVFVNRLRRGMRLQSDPTVIYGVTLGQESLGRPISRADLNDDNPFNTYRIDALPPTPIANPGRASIAAVLDPLETDELYFVADGSGGHAFAKTLREHNRNVRAWRRLQRGN